MKQIVRMLANVKEMVNLPYLNKWLRSFSVEVFDAVKFVQ